MSVSRVSRISIALLCGLVGCTRRAPSIIDAGPGKQDAIAVYRGFADATVHGDRAKIASKIAPTIILAQGEPAVVDAAAKVVQRYGPFALGYSADDIKVQAQGDKSALEIETLVQGEHQSRGVVHATIGTTGRIELLEVLLRSGPFDKGRPEQVLSISAAGITGSIVGWAPKRADVVLTMEGAIEAPRDRYVVARRGTSYCAVKLTSEPGDHVSYDALDLGDGSQLPRTARRTPGRVWEANTPTSTPGISSTRSSHLVIQCGGISISWSAPAYLYFKGINFGDGDAGELPALDLAITDASTEGQLDLHAPKLTWLSNRWGDAAWSIDAEEKPQRSPQRSQ
jgi:hypothetical protein